MTRIISRDERGLPLAKGTVIAGEWVFAYVNRAYRFDGTVPGFLYFPAKSAGAWNIVGSGFVQELARRGYPVVCGDYGDTPTRLGNVDGPGVWGNNGLVTKAELYRAYLQAAPELGGLGAKPGKIGVLYGSHGCPGAYSYAFAHPDNVSLIGGGIGTCDVEDIRANNRGSGGGFAASIEAAYTNNAGWQAARAAHNPVEIASALTAIPQLDYYAPDDPWCVASTHAALAAAAGSAMTQRSLGNVGHSFVGLGPRGSGLASQVTAFADWVEAHL